MSILSTFLTTYRRRGSVSDDENIHVQCRHTWAFDNKIRPDSIMRASVLHQFEYGQVRHLRENLWSNTVWCFRYNNGGVVLNSLKWRCRRSRSPEASWFRTDATLHIWWAVALPEWSRTIRCDANIMEIALNARKEICFKSVNQRLVTAKL